MTERTEGVEREREGERETENLNRRDEWEKRRSENRREVDSGRGEAQWIREDRLSSCVEYMLW